MAFSVAQLTARVREHMAGFPPDDFTNEAGDSVALNIVNEAHGDVARHGNVLAEEAQILLLAYNVARYALDPYVVRVNAANFFTASNDSIPLRETSIDELDYRSRGWRSWGAGDPYCYYRNGHILGVHPAPQRVQAGGYPCVVLSVVRAVPFDSASDLLPASVIDLDAYVEACKFRYALRSQPDAAAVSGPMSQAALTNLRTDMQRTLIRQKSQVRHRGLRIR